MIQLGSGENIQAYIFQMEQHMEASTFGTHH